jgi:tetrahydromethanopterin S-methyltransferase subunit B
LVLLILLDPITDVVLKENIIPKNYQDMCKAQQQLSLDLPKIEQQVKEMEKLLDYLNIPLQPNQEKFNMKRRRSSIYTVQDASPRKATQGLIKRLEQR